MLGVYKRTHKHNHTLQPARHGDANRIDAAQLVVGKVALVMVVQGFFLCRYTVLAHLYL